MCCWIVSPALCIVICKYGQLNCNEFWRTEPNHWIVQAKQANNEIGGWASNQKSFLVRRIFVMIWVWVAKKGNLQLTVWFCGISLLIGSIWQIEHCLHPKQITIISLKSDSPMCLNSGKFHNEPQRRRNTEQEMNIDRMNKDWHATSCAQSGVNWLAAGWTVLAFSFSHKKWLVAESSRIKLNIERLSLERVERIHLFVKVFGRCKLVWCRVQMHKRCAHVNE